MSQDATLQPVAAKLADLDARMSQAASASARRNTINLVLSILLAVGVAIYLWYGYSKVKNELTATAIAEASRGYVQNYLNENSQAMAEQLAGTAPQVIARLETQVRDIPPQLSTHLRDRTRTELAKHMPELEQELERSIRTGLAQAEGEMAKMPGKTDEEKLSALLETLAQVYGDQCVQAIDEFRQKYRDGAKDILGHLDMLADGKSLDHEQQLQRDVLVKFLTVADYYEKHSGQTDPTATSIHTDRANIPGTK